jgi:hypothetical protein
LVGMLIGRFVCCVVTGTAAASCSDDGSECGGSNDLVVGSVLDRNVDFEMGIDDVSITCFSERLRVCEETRVSEMDLLRNLLDDITTSSPPAPECTCVVPP